MAIRLFFVLGTSICVHCSVAFAQTDVSRTKDIFTHSLLTNQFHAISFPQDRQQILYAGNLISADTYEVIYDLRACMSDQNRRTAYIEGDATYAQTFQNNERSGKISASGEIARFINADLEGDLQIKIEESTHPSEGSENTMFGVKADNVLAPIGMVRELIEIKNTWCDIYINSISEKYIPDGYIIVDTAYRLHGTITKNYRLSVTANIAAGVEANITNVFGFLSEVDFLRDIANAFSASAELRIGGNAINSVEQRLVYGTDPIFVSGFKPKYVNTRRIADMIKRLDTNLHTRMASITSYEEAREFLRRHPILDLTNQECPLILLFSGKSLTEYNTFIENNQAMATQFSQIVSQALRMNILAENLK